MIEPQGPAILDLLNGSLTAQDALSGGQVHVEGDPAHLELFTRLFHIPCGSGAPDRAGRALTPVGAIRHTAALFATRWAIRRNGLPSGES